MKKIYGILISAGVLLSMLSIVAMAAPIDGQSITADSGLASQQPDKQIPEDEQINITSPSGFVKIRGTWGYQESNESIGNFAGRIVKKGNVVHLVGQYRTNDNQTKGKMAGVLIRGYFNGKFTSADGKEYKITGLYKYDKENKTLKIRWMTADYNGWAVGKIIDTTQ